MPMLDLYERLKLFKSNVSDLVVVRKTAHIHSLIFSSEVNLFWPN